MSRCAQKNKAKARARRKQRRDNRLALVVESRQIYTVMPKGELKRMMNEDARPFRATEIKHA